MDSTSFPPTSVSPHVPPAILSDDPKELLPLSSSTQTSIPAETKTVKLKGMSRSMGYNSGLKLLKHGLVSPNDPEITSASWRWYKQGDPAKPFSPPSSSSTDEEESLTSDLGLSYTIKRSSSQTATNPDKSRQRYKPQMKIRITSPQSARPATSWTGRVKVRPLSETHSKEDASLGLFSSLDPESPGN